MKKRKLLALIEELKDEHNCLRDAWDLSMKSIGARLVALEKAVVTKLDKKRSG